MSKPSVGRFPYQVVPSRLTGKWEMTLTLINRHQRSELEHTGADRAVTGMCLKVTNPPARGRARKRVEVVIGDELPMLKVCSLLITVTLSCVCRQSRLGGGDCAAVLSATASC